MYKQEAPISPLTAIILTSTVTFATLFGLAMGKKMEKVPVHIEIPSRRRYSHAASTD